MSDEQDSWFKSALGVDLGDLASKAKQEASTVVADVTSTVSAVVQSVENTVDTPRRSQGVAEPQYVLLRA